MRWAIDIGNTQTVVGIHDGSSWTAVLRLKSDPERTEDEIAGWLFAALKAKNFQFSATEAIIGSVVPTLDSTWRLFFEKWLNIVPIFLTVSEKLGIPIEYEPKSAVGADRLANALGALRLYKPPIIVVDFGTATTFDAVSAKGHYVGGAILPGPIVSARALVDRTAKLPQIAMTRPQFAIGKTTTQSLQSGIVLGYAYAIDGLAREISLELGGAKIISTGGLGEVFSGICKEIEEFVPTLTLDGLLVAAERLKQ